MSNPTVYIFDHHLLQQENMIATFEQIFSDRFKKETIFNHNVFIVYWVDCQTKTDEKGARSFLESDMARQFFSQQALANFKDKDYFLVDGKIFALFTKYIAKTLQF